MMSLSSSTVVPVSAFDQDTALALELSVNFINTIDVEEIEYE